MALTQTEIERLMLRARGGDDAALGTLIGGIRERIYRWAMIITADSDDAEDATQQVSIILHQKIRGFQERARFTTWLYTVTRNAAIEVRRKAGRRHETPMKEDEVAGTLSDDAESRLATIQNTRAAALVRSYFTDLPARQRELIELIDKESYTAAEAAELMGIEPETARVHLLRARRSIRTRMLETHPEMFT